MAIGSTAPRRRLAGPADPRSIGRIVGPLYAAFTGRITDRLRAETNGAVRAAHSPIFIYIEDEGSTLTELAAKARMTKAAMKELVDDLEANGFLVRRPSPKDGRAKLIFTTDRGERLIERGRALIAQIEADWAKQIGKRRFEALKTDLRQILEYESRDSETFAL